jgi:hypothetical protein
VSCRNGHVIASVGINADVLLINTWQRCWGKRSALRRPHVFEIVASASLIADLANNLDLNLAERANHLIEHWLHLGVARFWRLNRQSHKDVINQSKDHSVMSLARAKRWLVRTRNDSFTLLV